MRLRCSRIFYISRERLSVSSTIILSRICYIFSSTRLIMKLVKTVSIRHPAHSAKTPTQNPRKGNEGVARISSTTLSTQNGDIKNGGSSFARRDRECVASLNLDLGPVVPDIHLSESIQVCASSSTYGSSDYGINIQ